MKRDATGRGWLGPTLPPRWQPHPCQAAPRALPIDAKAPLYEPSVRPTRVFEMREWSVCEMRDHDEDGAQRRWQLVCCEVVDMTTGDWREVHVIYAQAFVDAHGLETGEALMLDARARMVEELTPRVGTHGWGTGEQLIVIRCVEPEDES